MAELSLFVENNPNWGNKKPKRTLIGNISLIFMIKKGSECCLR